ncbi:MAG: prepilin-type N-terminal cleavage/methylation domain-containing protein [Betaproteobacteria bacterium]|nr:prepilin-type N-terminal cleavage/methylation domain-containing protein [Betaproteobacteria bacterium]
MNVLTLSRGWSSQRYNGFSLIEVAVVLTILTVLLFGISVPLTAQVESRRLDDTRKQLEQANLAILGFVSAYGRFPCPASNTSNGLESFCTSATGACTPTTNIQTHGRCSNFYDGFLPSSTLGLTPLDGSGFWRDAWGSINNRVRYAVRELTFTVGTTTYSRVLTTTDAANDMKAATMANIIGVGASPRDLLSVCKDGAAVTGFDCNNVPNTLTTQAPAVVFSLGPNASTTGGTSIHESKNIDGNQVFIFRDREAGAGEFDDVVSWLSLYTVFNRLIEVGRLP